jgi:hypothetical protein
LSGSSALEPAQATLAEQWGRSRRRFEAVVEAGIRCGLSAAGVSMRSNQPWGHGQPTCSRRSSNGSSKPGHLSLARAGQQKSRMRAAKGRVRHTSPVSRPLQPHPAPLRLLGA